MNIYEMKDQIFSMEKRIGDKLYYLYFFGHC
jgi:hypothetical protein